jgi:hypothetical protein
MGRMVIGIRVRLAAGVKEEITIEETESRFNLSLQLGYVLREGQCTV